MPPVMIVDWKHILLDPAVFQLNGTYRVARVRGGISAFPVKDSGHWESNVRHWRPEFSGEAPPEYEHDGRRFTLGFWAVREFNDGRLRGESEDTNDFSVGYADGNVRVEAKAIYYWDFAGGPGEHAVYVDAFDDTNQEFIGLDFVDVNPDDEVGTSTAHANNGRLATTAIDRAVIRSLSPLESVTHYGFDKWTNEQDLSDQPGGRETVPRIEGQNIHIHRDSVIAALARYTVTGHAEVPHIRKPLAGGYVIDIGNGQFLFIPLFPPGPPVPVGPWGDKLLSALKPSAPVDREGYSRRLEFEQESINRRVTWLLASQTILFATYGLALDRTSQTGASMFLKTIPSVGIATSVLILLGIVAAFLARYFNWQAFKKESGNQDEPFGAGTWITYMGFVPDVALPLMFIIAWTLLAGR